MKENKKQMIDDYKIESRVWVGTKQYLFGVHKDRNESQRYMKCRAYQRDIFDVYDKGMTSNDYFSAMKHYIQDITEALHDLEQQKDGIGLEDISCLQKKDLFPVDDTMMIQDQIVAIDEKYLADGYKDISHQLFYTQSGHGLLANSRGNACFCYNLYTGEMERIERYEIIGIVPEDKLPLFAKATLLKLQEELKAEKREIENNK